jgi:ADP-heptose:LPS heptosyltransferase
MDFPRYWTPQIPPRPGAIHTLDCLADILEEEIGVIIPRDERFPHLELREAARAWVADYCARYELGSRPLVALVPESNMLIKKWGATGWAYLSDALYEKGNTPIIFSQPNSPLVAAIQQRAKHPPLVVSTTLDNVAAFLELCQLCIGVDTGLLHIASAVETPWLGLFGPTNPEVTGPYNSQIGRYLVAPFQRGENCRNCWKNFKYEDDKCRALTNGSCIDYLDKRQVLETAVEMLEKPVTFLTEI